VQLKPGEVAPPTSSPLILQLRLLLLKIVITMISWMRMLQAFACRRYRKRRVFTWQLQNATIQQTKYSIWKPSCISDCRIIIVTF